MAFSISEITSKHITPLELEAFKEYFHLQSCEFHMWTLLMNMENMTSFEGSIMWVKGAI